MRRHFLLAILAIFLLANSSSAEDKIPAAVKPILEKAVREVKKNRDDFTKANEKPLNEARKELEALSTKLIKDGKAEEAALVLKQIGTLETEVLRAAAATVPAAGKPALSKKPLLERMAGKWRHPNSTLIRVCSMDGSYSDIHTKDGRVVHAGRITIKSPEVAQVQAGPYSYEIRMSEDGDAMLLRTWDASGKEDGVGWVLERAK